MNKLQTVRLGWEEMVNLRDKITEALDYGVISMEFEVELSSNDAIIPLWQFNNN